jgi:hypothetical protein
MQRIFIGGIPDKIKQEDIKSQLTKVLPIFNLHMKQKFGKKVGYAFFEVSSYNEARKLIEKPLKIKGVELYCQLSHKTLRANGNSMNNRVYLKDLPIHLPDQDLKYFLSEIVQVRSAYSIKDEKGISKGYGFADLKDEREVERLSQLGHLVIQGHQIKVEKYTERIPNKDKGKIVEHKKKRAKKRTALTRTEQRRRFRGEDQGYGWQQSCQQFGLRLNSAIRDDHFGQEFKGLGQESNELERYTEFRRMRRDEFGHRPRPHNGHKFGYGPVKQSFYRREKPFFLDNKFKTFGPTIQGHHSTAPLKGNGKGEFHSQEEMELPSFHLYNSLKKIFLEEFGNKRSLGAKTASLKLSKVIKNCERLNQKPLNYRLSKIRQPEITKRERKKRLKKIKREIKRSMRKDKININEQSPNPSNGYQNDFRVHNGLHQAEYF